VADNETGVTEQQPGETVTPNPAAVDNTVASTLMEQYGFLPLNVRYAAAKAARYVVENAQQDPRDAEIERLRAALAKMARGVNRQSARANAAEVGIEHWQGLAETRGAQVEEFASGIRELTAERDRLQERLDQHLADENSAQAANDRLREELDKVSGGWQARVESRQKLMQERDEARQEWKRADAEVTRLKRLVGGENVPDGWDGYSRADAIVRAEEAYFSAIRQRDENVELINERDRLRAELTGERAVYADSPDDRLYHAADHTWWRRNEDGRLVHADAPDSARNDVIAERDAMANALVAVQHILTGVDKQVARLEKPAEPRRWTTGDPEPEIGTTIRSARGGTYTLLATGYWHRDDDCTYGPDNCDEAGYSWTWLTRHGEHLPLVEVVSTDGE
jgi:outer membrane murein-binding lipoprotein Lpp